MAANPRIPSPEVPAGMVGHGQEPVQPRDLGTPQMDEARLGELQKFYVSNGVVPKEAPLKDLYTNQFVNAK